MELTLTGTGPETIRAGYICPCGCTPSVEYVRGAAVASEGCCCGNQFAVGPQAAEALGTSLGFRAEVQEFAAAWGEPLEAAWLVGPSAHGPAEGAAHDHDHDHDHDHQHAMDVAAAARVTDPVCGMTVEPGTARANGLHSVYGGFDYFFCGKGCKLEFDDDPERYLDPAYTPFM